jgi:hypothetical protein
MVDTVKFDLVAGPFEGPANGVAWDGEGLLFALMEAQKLMRLDPASGEVAELRKYTSRTNGVAFGPSGELYGCQEASRRLIEFLPDSSRRCSTANTIIIRATCLWTARVASGLPTRSVRYSRSGRSSSRRSITLRCCASLGTTAAPGSCNV